MRAGYRLCRAIYGERVKGFGDYIAIRDITPPINGKSNGKRNRNCDSLGLCNLRPVGMA